MFLDKAILDILLCAENIHFYNDVRNMKKLYYFSKSKLKFVEAKNLYPLFIVLFLVFTIVFSGTLFGIYYMFNPESQVNLLKSRNQNLKKELSLLKEQYSDFEKQLNKLAEKNNELRLSVNLDPISLEERNVGVGGSIFETVKPANADEFSSAVNTLEEDVETISAKMNFEMGNFKEIQNKLNQNQKLYDAIPALKPASASIGDKFGMRMHPILKVKRMHAGLDFLVNTGSPVYAPGSGRVIYAARKVGLGKTVIIDHGFGYKTYYGHLSEFKVKKGDKVKRGDLIAKSGNTGELSTGPHLHYEVRHNGVALDPTNFIFEDVKIFNASVKK